MKKIGIAIILVLLIVSLQASAYEAVTQDGQIVILNDDGTWVYKHQVWDKDLSQPILPEPELYRLALMERDADLFDQYLANYEGVDAWRTITIICNYVIPGVRRGEYQDLLLKGVALSSQNNLYFLCPFGTVWGINEQGLVSNLYFYWELGSVYEVRGEYREALYWYEELLRLFTATGENLPFRIVGENTAEAIRGKIYLMKLKLQ